MTDLQLWLVCAEFASVVALNMVLKFDCNCGCDRRDNHSLLSIVASKYC